MMHLLLVPFTFAVSLLVAVRSTATVDSFGETVTSFFGQFSRPFIRSRSSYVSPASQNFVRPDGTVKGVAINSGSLIEMRTLDAEGNNINDPELGTAHSETLHCADSQYADGINSLAGFSRPGAREISNQLFRSEVNPVSRRNLTQFAWQWGQFIDHDVTLIPGSTMEAIDIDIPVNDPVLQNARASFIGLNRSPAAPGTGLGTTVPREQENELTAFIDGSAIYGLDEERAKALRAPTDGLLATLGDAFFGILPRNDGTPPEDNEPELEPEHFPESLGLAGDPRPNEQIGLYNMHTIMVRLHNLIAAEVKDVMVARGQFTEDRDEAIYQITKVIVTGIVQKITYKDWLPALFGDFAVTKYLGDWPGVYWDGVDPRICIEFATAAFRFGHTMLPNSIPLRNADCTVWTDFDPAECPSCDVSVGGIPLKDAFFVQGVFLIPGFFEAAHNGFRCTLAGETDLTIVEGVRDFLFGDGFVNGQNVFPTPLDLVSLNIQRGREHGLADYNTIRRFYRLSPRESFDEITEDVLMQERLREASVGDIDNIDAFVGFLAEDHLPGGSFGETLSKVVLDQFKKIRDGDRFWYENYLRPDSTIRAYIEQWTLEDIVRETSVNPQALFKPTQNIFLNDDGIAETETVFTTGTSAGL